MTACCAAGGKQGWVGAAGGGAGEEWVPLPAPSPHRHHVVLQLLQPHAALVAAAAGGSQAVVGLVEGGRGCPAIIGLKCLVGTIAAGGQGRRGSVGAGTALAQHPSGRAVRMCTCPRAGNSQGAAAAVVSIVAIRPICAAALTWGGKAELREPVCEPQCCAHALQPRVTALKAPTPASIHSLLLESQGRVGVEV